MAFARGISEMRISWIVLVCLVVGTQAKLASSAEESKTVKSEGAKIESKISDHDKSPCLGACHVNFRKELGLSFDYLDGIGLRIHDAAERPDPVELAAAAKSLAVAEMVSGKQASVTSDQLMKEAVKLATIRQVPEELKGVAMLVDDESAKAELGKAEEEAKAADTGERPRAILRSLIVTNHAGECLYIYIDGRPAGEVHEGETQRLPVHSHRTPNHLTAYCLEEGHVVDHAHFWGTAQDVAWHIGR
jgi:hypothetical protein